LGIHKFEIEEGFMSAFFKCGIAVVILVLVGKSSIIVHSQEAQPSNQQIAQELEALKIKLQEIDATKARILQLEEQLKANTATVAAAKAEADKAKAEADKAKAEADAQAIETARSKQVLDKLSLGRLQLGRTNIFFDGWVEGSMGWRKHDEIAGPSQTSALSPYPVQAQYGAQEFEAGPPQTRFGINTVSDLSGNLVLKAKLQFDMLSSSNVANTANGSSYTPRLRHAWAEVDDVKTGWHFLMGQAYSLSIPNGSLVGADGSDPANLGWMLLPGTEVITQPDDGVIMGLGTTRSVQFRVVKEIAKNAAVAISLENNIVNWGGDKGTALPFTPIISQSSYSSSSLFTSFGLMPDIIGKIGYDPTTRYHFEAWGILRQYRDRDGVVAANIMPSTGKTYGKGGNLGTYTKVVPQKLDFHAGVGYGSFGSVIDSVVPDVTYDSTGKPIPIYDQYVFGEFIAHPNRNLDIYFQSGVERGLQAGVSGTTTATAYGFGNRWGSGSSAGNAACLIQSASSLTATCKQDTHVAWNYSITPDWRPVNSKTRGHLDFMPQIEYIDRKVFKDQFGYAPRTSNVAVDICFRYWPF
jgi:hypothetical protein